MITRGLYFASDDFSAIIQNAGGVWNDTKQRPVVCLVKSKEHDKLYWAIPMGNYHHRNKEQIKRLNKYLAYPSKDIRSCYYHIGRTTTKSIFFISDAIPITEKYIKRNYLGYDNQPYIIKNPNLIAELERKLFRILSIENSRPNYFRQHITDVKEYLIKELYDDEKTQPDK